MKTVSDIRQAFLDYFGDNDHEIVASSPLVPDNDPTLMFTNSGMVQFKNVFTGGETRAIPRAVTSQKCVRAGGKHNDLENVGHTARHHTFFEMLGNFSFGDYFKERAIHHAWELVTKIYGLDADKLLVTIYHDDEEAAKWWKKVAGLGDDRIIRIATSDNFWAMGDTGPCGPCSEIFYDHGDGIPGGPPGSPDEDGDRFIEIWNLVFMQYEQRAPDDRIELPSPSIDTGMGLERIAAVMQGKHDNYDTDLMQALIKASADIAGTAGDGEHAVSHRVIADHLRASSFLIADGVLPSNEGRGYVLRRIMRRAMRHAHQMGCTEPMMHRLLPALIEQMGGHFTELEKNRTLIASTLETEESRFKETLDRGLKILMGEMEGKDSGTLDGATAFKLYDTFGFPLDLTQDVLRGKNWSVDVAGFDTAMEKQKQKARKAWSGSGDAGMAQVFVVASDRIGATDFLGYDRTASGGEVLAIIKDDAETDSAGKGDEVSIITNQTPFYAESGGQIGDTGHIADSATGEMLAEVTNTWKTPAGTFVHDISVRGGVLSVGTGVNLMVNELRRNLLRANHSATHLMHEALRQVLGNHVMQKGSMVADDRLRFDFSHGEAVNDDDIAKVEAIVGERITANDEVTTRLMTPDAAVAEGALALFGEKYGDEVRVVSMGGASADKDRAAWSVELCGGTHVARSGDIGVFKITGESAVAGGVRRIEAVTSEGAERWLDSRKVILGRAMALLGSDAESLVWTIEHLLATRRKAGQIVTELRKAVAIGADTKSLFDSAARIRVRVGGSATPPPAKMGGDAKSLLDSAAAAMKCPPEVLPERLQSLLDEIRKAGLQIEKIRTGGGDDNADSARIGAITFEKRVLDDTPPKDLKPLAESILAGEDSKVVAVISGLDGKASLVVAVSKNITGQLSAVDLVRAGSEALGGKGGGGRPDMAQAGGPDASAADAAMKEIESVIRKSANA